MTWLLSSTSYHDLHYNHYLHHHDMTIIIYIISWQYHYNHYLHHHDMTIIIHTISWQSLQSLSASSWHDYHHLHHTMTIITIIICIIMIWLSSSAPYHDNHYIHYHHHYIIIIIYIIPWQLLQPSASSWLDYTVHVNRQCLLHYSRAWSWIIRSWRVFTCHGNWITYHLISW